MEQKVSIKKNTVFNVIKSLSTVIFPLITFPYVSRVLGADNVGKVNFSSSIVSYLSLIASLGITTYAIRECAKAKENEYELNKLASQIYSINITSTIVAYVVLLVVLIFAKPIYGYRGLILIQAVTVLFSTLGTDWINSAMEDFKYITIRTFLFQGLSIILMLLFVKESAHYYRYAMICVISASGGNIVNIFYRRKYCKISYTLRMDIKKHLKPIMLVFSLILSQTIYCNSDMTILGLIKGDYQVGLYSVAVRIYTIVNTMVASIALVVMPQMSKLFQIKKYDEINKLVRYAMDCIVVIGFPVITGIACIAPELVEIIAGPEYIGATLALRILMISLLFSYLGGIVSNVIMIPSGREKICLKTSVISAIINVVFNFILIPRFGLYAAATTTALAEGVALCVISRHIEKEIKFGKPKEVFLGPIVGCASIACVTYVIKSFELGLWFRTILIIILSVLSYALAMIVTKNKFVMDIFNSFIKKLKK